MQASARLSSSAASKKVIAGVSSTITRSCYRTSRGKAHAAPLSAQEPPAKGQKKNTKQERRVRIEEFVQQYRASNDGKFPTITNVRQQFGGSHYTVREILQELEYNLAKSPLDNAKAAQFQGTDEELSRPKDESKAAQLHSSPKDDNGKNPDSGEGFQSTVDVVISQKDATTSTGIIEKTKTWKSVGPSHYGVETEAAEESLNTSEAFKNVNGPTSSDQTESGSMKVITNEPSISLGVEVKSDSGNKQGKTEANKNAETFLDAHESTVSDQSGSGKVIEGNISDREHGPKHELQESSNTGLLGSLKSFAYGIRNFLKNI